MAIKHRKEKKIDEEKKYIAPTFEAPSGQPKLPSEMEEKLKSIKAKIEEFQTSIMKEFEQYIIGIALLPPTKKEEKSDSANEGSENPKTDEERINILVLIDDSDSKKMAKEELKAKLSSIMEKIATGIDPKLLPSTILLSELWVSCFDAKYDLLQTIASCAPIYDTGMLQAIKIAEIHKTMVLKKFEKYIVSYVLAGSLVQGKSTKSSDIDVWIVIDDTDVKKMTRTELKDKLRAIIIGMGLEAGELTGIKNKLNIQVYILTDFWDSLREANPIIFTLLRDGVPFYDRGIFMPWKQLLQMGKIKPSAEAIEMFMETGEQMLKRVEYKLKDMGMEDIYYAILTPSQAALMLYGVPPPAPRETGHLMRELFVKKEKILEEKYIEILERNIDLRKGIEHGTKKEISGKEVDELLDSAKEYLERVKKLFSQIEKAKEEESMVKVYETSITIVRDVLKTEGVEKVSDEDILELFNQKLVCAGKAPSKYMRMLKEITKAKHDYDSKKLTKTEVEKVKKDANEFVKFLIEYLQRKHARDIERTKLRVKYGEKYADLIFIGKDIYFVLDIGEKDKQRISSAELLEGGAFSEPKPSSQDKLESAFGELKRTERILLTAKFLECLKKTLGEDAEIVFNY